MSALPMLSPEEFTKIKRYFPCSHGIRRVDDLRVVSGIIAASKQKKKANPADTPRRASSAS